MWRHFTPCQSMVVTNIKLFILGMRACYISRKKNSWWFSWLHIMWICHCNVGKTDRLKQNGNEHIWCHQNMNRKKCMYFDNDPDHTNTSKRTSRREEEKRSVPNGMSWKKTHNKYVVNHSSILMISISETVLKEVGPII
jgi:hypothetical protein